jgi:hypothetical protein
VQLRRGESESPVRPPVVDVLPVERHCQVSGGLYCEVRIREGHPHCGLDLLDRVEDGSRGGGGVRGGHIVGED